MLEDPQDALSDDDQRSVSGESATSDHEDHQPKRQVLGETFLSNKHQQRLNNHPAIMAKRTTKNSSSKRKSPDGENGNDSDATMSAEQLKDQALRKANLEIARLKERQKITESKKKGRKSKGNSTDSATHTLVWETTREKFFGKCKFLANEDQLLKATEQVMEMLVISDFDGLEGTKLAAAQEKWIQKYKSAVRDSLNNNRNYIQNQMQTKFKEYVSEYGLDHVPDKEEILDAALRKGMTKEDPFPSRACDVFDFYWDVLIPVVASCKRWGPGKRHYCLMSTARPENDPSQQLFVTPSDEAYAALAWENYLGPWTYKWEQAHKDKEPKKADSAAQAADPKTNDANPETKDADPEASEAEANDKPTAGGKTGGKTGGKAGGKKQIAKRGKKQAGEAKEDEDLDADDVEPEEEDEDSGEVDPRSIAPYTMPNGGVQEFGGWNKAGRKRYRQLLEMITKSKGLSNRYYNFKGSKAQIKHVEAVEKACLARLRAEYGIDDKKKRRKKNPAASKNEDVDSDHEVDWA